MFTRRRRRSGAFTLALATTLACAACGGSGGAAPKEAGAGPGDAGVDVPACAPLPCLASATSLIARCAPSGTCVEQVTVSGSTATQSKCFSNGVKIAVTGMEMASGATTTVMAVQKDGAACYSFVAMAAAGGSVGSAVYQDGAATDLITEMVNGATTTFTCPGGSPITPDSSCDAALFALQGLYPFTNGSCTSGACSF